MKKLLFIFNPASGKARIKGQLFEVINYYTKNNYLVTVFSTQYSGQILEVFKDISEEYDYIVCSGGDGTLNEVVSAMIEQKREIPLGYLPAGSTNDFAKSAGIPFELEEALYVSLFGKKRFIDIGMLNERYFVYVAAFGLFTSVSYSTPQKYKNTLGYLAYLLEGIKQISELKSYHIEITWDNNTIQDEFIIGLVTNSLSIGGFKNPTSADVRLNDGLFEVLLIKKPNNILELQAIISSLLNEKINTSNLLYFQTSYLEIRSEELNWTIDGEYGGKYEKVVIQNRQRSFAIMGKDEESKCIL